MDKGILIMDTDVNSRSFLYDILMQLNYKVTTIPSSEGVIEILKKERSSCLILDIEALKIFDRSVNILRKIREIDNDLRVLVLVSNPEEEMLVNKFSDDKVMFLRKNVDAPAFVQVILKILGSKQSDDVAEKADFKGGILIVDDEQESGELIRGYLQRKGYSTAVAFNGEEAILKIKSIRPKVVILDILMSGMDGLCVLKQIKEIDDSIFVIITSGIQNEKVMKEASELGADTYLIKPFNLEKLEAFILGSALKQMGKKSPSEQ